MRIRPANKKDCLDLARLINLAGEGIPECLWAEMSQTGQDPLTIGARRSARESGAFSYKNAQVLEVTNQVAGMILGYVQPDPYVVGDLNQYPALVRPLLKLEVMAPGSWYINGIAVYEKFRQRGLGARLMAAAENAARHWRCEMISIIVAEENLPARNLYAKMGYREHAGQPIVNYPGCHYRGDWILMLKPVTESLCVSL